MGAFPKCGGGVRAGKKMKAAASYEVGGAGFTLHWSFNISLQQSSISRDKRPQSVQLPRSEVAGLNPLLSYP